MKYDIIGDIHGHAKKLRKLLGKLGYSDKNGYYRHPDPKRKAIFVGDFIDRGPRIRETLSIVKSMLENDAAFAVMGNHEYNALCFHTKKAGRSNSCLRAHSKKNVEQHAETLRQFENNSDEWQEYLKWFRSLPLYLEIENFRVVHAAWIPSEIDRVSKWTSGCLQLNDDLLEKSANEGSEEFDAIETVLKGVEIKLPDACPFKDKDENPREKIRIRWWETPVNKTYGEMIFPKEPLKCGKEKIAREETAELSAYNDTVPVFFGHYWLDPSKHELRIQTEHICCLDYSVAKKGILAAYCWEGEKTLRNNRLVCV
jgi:hypothetical protein